MKDNFNIFYSWQYDLRKTKNDIGKSIKDAINKISKGKTIKIVLDSDTKRTSGSPNIVQTILKKIDKADIFICDVTLINNRTNSSKLTPNPNVLIELGYAINSLGFKRIIMICNEHFEKVDKLPFDIRGQRILTYNENDPKYKTKLVDAVNLAITHVIDDYDNILSEIKAEDYKVFDLDIFNKINAICSEEQLDESISSAVDGFSISKYYLKIWRKLEVFYSNTLNHFIDNEIDNLNQKFLKELELFHLICGKNFFPKETYIDQNIKNKLASRVELSDEEQKDYDQSNIIGVIKEARGNETWHEADLRVDRIQDELFEQGKIVKESYRQLIKRIKEKVLT